MSSSSHSITPSQLKYDDDIVRESLNSPKSSSSSFFMRQQHHNKTTKHQKKTCTHVKQKNNDVKTLLLARSREHSPSRQTQQPTKHRRRRSRSQTRYRTQQQQQPLVSSSKSPSLSLRVLEQVMLPPVVGPPIPQQQQQQVESNVARATNMLNSVMTDDNDDDNDDLSSSLHTGEEAIAFFAKYGSTTTLKFVYCIPLYDENDFENFFPYDLKVVKRRDVHGQYYIISSTGVVHVKPGETSEFISLGDWLHQATAFKILRNLRFFKTFSIAKTFQMWRRNVRFSAYCTQRQLVSKKLFRYRGEFLRCFNEMKSILCGLDEIRLIHTTPYISSNDDFISNQLSYRSIASNKFDDIAERLGESIARVCTSVYKRLKECEDVIAEEENNSLIWNFVLDEARSKSMGQIREEKEARLQSLVDAQNDVALLGSFLRLAEMLFGRALMNCCIQSAFEFHNALLARSHKKPLIKMDVHIDSDGIHFVPTMDTIITTIKSILDHNITAIATIKSLTSTNALQEYTSIIQQQQHHAGFKCTRLDTLVQCDPDYIRIYEAIFDCLDNDYTNVCNSVVHLEEYVKVYEFGRQWDANAYETSTTHTEQSLEDDLIEQDTLKNNIEKNIRMTYGNGVLQVCCGLLRDSLLPICENALIIMKKQCVKLYHDRLKHIQQQYAKQLKELDDNPKDLNEFAIHVEKVQSIKIQTSILSQQTVTVNRLYNVLQRFNVRVPHAYAVMSDDIQTQEEAFEQKLNDTEGAIDEQIMAMRQRVNVEISHLNHELETQKESLCDGMYVSEDATPTDVLNSLETVRVKLDTIKQRTITLQGYQVLFGIDPYSFHLLPQTEAEFSDCLIFWTRYNEWLHLIETWDTQNFRELDVELMNHKVQSMWKYSTKVWKKQHEFANSNEYDGRKGLQLSIKFRESVREFRDIMSVVLELGNNSAMKAVHWRQLYTAMGEKYFPDAIIKLRKLRVMGVFNEANHDIITKVVETAVGENVLANSLNRIERTWEKMEFVLVRYTFANDNGVDTDETYILGDVDEVYETLEEHEATLKTMLTSKYVSTLSQQIMRWKTRLNDLNELVENWLAFQKTWLYLECVFNAGDIQIQMPVESKIFSDADQFWRQIMQKINQNRRVLSVFQVCENLAAQFAQEMTQLEQVSQHLDSYLELKRAVFPRLYLLSNDELLSIVSETRKPECVVQHLSKIFENIVSLEMQMKKQVMHITTISDGHGEYVTLCESVMTSRSAEKWLKRLDACIQETILRSLLYTTKSIPSENRHRWLLQNGGAIPDQIALVINNIMWTNDVERILKASNTFSLYHTQVNKNIEKLVDMLHTATDEGQRQLLSNMIVQSVHHRDIVHRLDKASDDINEQMFQWKSQLRYYCNIDDECVYIRQLDAEFEYGCEYLGNTPRLVITPLTERAFVTMTQALSVSMFSSSIGPAGTGKTETVKELGKAIAVPTLIFNCSDAVNTITMSRLLAGVSSIGAFACFDEFNRIGVDVLSVVAQQISDLQSFVRQCSTENNDDDDDSKRRFDFYGRSICINSRYAVFVTMNPNDYTGRTELPDNLKSLFRPIAMTKPDTDIIIEFILLSEGFTSCTIISKKIVKLYILCEQQLSYQDHYDFGLRAIKSALILAGKMRVESPHELQETLIINAVRNCNVPKLTVIDTPLFEQLIHDLFPQQEFKTLSSSTLEEAIHTSFLQSRLQPVPSLLSKTRELSITMEVRHGVMLVGAAGSGRSTCIDMLSLAYSKLGREVNTTRINPLSLSLSELYGEMNQVTNEWIDGVIPYFLRDMVARAQRRHDTYEWLVLDGPVMSQWVENSNTALDSSKVLCLANGERIKLPKNVAILFETANLSEAMPSTVSRCGMVYFDRSCLDWRPLITNWECISAHTLPQFISRHVATILLETLASLLEYVHHNRMHVAIHVPDNNLVNGCLRILDGLFQSTGSQWRQAEEFEEEALEQVSGFILMSIVWSFGAIFVSEHSRRKFSDEIYRVCQSHVLHWPDIEDDDSITLFDVCFADTRYLRWSTWKTLEARTSSNIQHERPVSLMYVPTINTLQFKFIANVILCGGRDHLLVSGSHGVGKSATIKHYFNNYHHHDAKALIQMPFSSNTHAQDIRSSLKTVMNGVETIVIIDDVHMPKQEHGGALELIRQCIDNQRGFHSVNPVTFLRLEHLQYVGCCQSTTTISMRLLNQFHHLHMVQPNDASLQHIFTNVLNGFIHEHGAPDVQNMVIPIVQASILLYRRVYHEFRSITNEYAHFTFNIRDIVQQFTGILLADASSLETSESLCLLWCHESSRVYRDRLVTDQQCEWFDDACCNTLISTLKQYNIHVPLVKPQVIKNTLFVHNHERQYVKEDNLLLLERRFLQYMGDYNIQFKIPLNLTFFPECIGHASRLLRVIEQPRGHAMLLGTSNGRKSLARLAAFMAGYTCAALQVTTLNYSMSEWRESLRQMLWCAGVEQKPIVFILEESQMMLSEMMCDVNTLLTRGSIEHFYHDDTSQLDSVYARLRTLTMTEDNDTNTYDSDDDRRIILDIFHRNIHKNLHLILLISPPSSPTFKLKCREYPSLVNNCTIDYYRDWSESALYSVARHLLAEGCVDDDLATEEQQLRHSLGKVCSYIHQTASNICNEINLSHGRIIHVSAAAFMTFIEQFHDIHTKTNDRLQIDVDRYFGGVGKLQQTKYQVDRLRQELMDLQPQLEIGAKALEELLDTIQMDTKNAEEIALGCKKEQEDCKLETKIVENIKNECQNDLNKVLPKYNAAVKALDTLKKEHITMLKSFKHPPVAVKKVMEAVCVLFNIKKPVWADAQKLVGSVKFLHMCKEYDKDNISPVVVKRLRKYVENEEFPTLQKLSSVSEAAVSLCLWVKSMNEYVHVVAQLQPKKQQLYDAQQKLEEAWTELHAKQHEVETINHRINILKETYEFKVDELSYTRAKVEDVKVRLRRAERLMCQLSDEHERWTLRAKQLQLDVKNVTGNSLMTAAFVSYLGPFPHEYRHRLLKEWIDFARNLHIFVDENFSLSNVLSNPIDLRSLSLHGLPSNQFSIESALICNTTKKWPLMLDPHAQAKNWLLSCYKDICIVDMNDFCMRAIEDAVQYGKALLLKNIRNIPLSIESLISKRLSYKRGIVYVKLGDKNVTYSPDFSLFMITEQSKPVFEPCVFARTCVIDFSITNQGLCQQMLDVVCDVERPELTEKQQQLVYKLNSERNELDQIEEKVLELINNSEGSLLDNDNLITTLETSKQKAFIVNNSIQETTTTMNQLTITRQTYQPVAERAVALYQSMNDLQFVNYMYQYSLEFFVSIFKYCIRSSPPASNLKKRVHEILVNTTNIVRNIVSQGLFNEHHFLFALLVAKRVDNVDESEWQILMNDDKTNEEDLVHIHADHKDIVHFIKSAHNHCKTTIKRLKTPVKWSNIMKNNELWPAKMQMFTKLLLIKQWRADLLIDVGTWYINRVLDDEKTFVNSVSSLKCIYERSNNHQPIVFLLVCGSNPLVDIMHLAQEYSVNVQSLALGQGQRKAAEEAIDLAREQGDWLVLQNCHLLKDLSFLNMQLKTKAHKSYRLWLSLLPCKQFPTTVLSHSLKVCTETPTDMLIIMKQLFSNLTQYEYDGEETTNNPALYRQLLWGLAWFHSYVLQRKLYNDWEYTWTTYDFITSQKILLRILNEYGSKNNQLPFAQLLYLIGDVNYGGRITNDHDKLLVITILKYILSQEFADGQINENVFVSPFTSMLSGPMPANVHDTSEHIDMHDHQCMNTPAMCGLHVNARIQLNLNRNNALIHDIINITRGTRPHQPSKAIVVDLRAKLTILLEKITRHIELDDDVDDTDDGNNKDAALKVLRQEQHDLHGILTHVCDELFMVQNIFEGETVVSKHISDIYDALVNNTVTNSWLLYANRREKHTVSLQQWYRDLHDRVEYIIRLSSSSINTKNIQISKFVKPMNFITAVRQTAARIKHWSLQDVDIYATIATNDDDDDDDDDVYILQGLYLDGGCTYTNSKLGETKSMQLLSSLYGVKIKAIKRNDGDDDDNDNDDEYVFKCPLYINNQYILSVFIPCESPTHWIERGITIHNMNK